MKLATYNLKRIAQECKEKTKQKFYVLRFTFRDKRGFTLVELVIFLSIVVFVATLFSNGLSVYRDSQALSTSAETIVSAISTARVKTISSEGGEQFSVYFENGRAVVFSGTIFSGASSSDKEFKTENAVIISAINLAASPNTMVFQKIIGQTQNYGNIILSTKTDPNKRRTVFISKTGEVSRQ
ncbi:MAG: prepilin-type N-terminal cleavage/methylation domain-containing protein [Patescibacteria group bacterium]